MIGLQPVLVYVLASPTLRRSHLFDRRTTIVQRRAERGLRWLGVTLWLYLALGAIALRGTAVGALRALLQVGVSVGALSAMRAAGRSATAPSNCRKPRGDPRAR